MGYLFVVSGPSAVGKTTVVDYIVRKNPEFVRVITCTSRAVRPGEHDGVDYVFLSKDEFQRKIDGGEFVEFSKIYGNYYGVLLSSIKNSIEKHDVSFLVINWEGFLKIKKSIAENVTGIFLNPPSSVELERRIRGRNSDSEVDIKTRLETARDDMEHAVMYDFVIENRKVEEAADGILRIMSQVMHNENR